jgi:hypothetical protein
LLGSAVLTGGCLRIGKLAFQLGDAILLGYLALQFRNVLLGVVGLHGPALSCLDRRRHPMTGCRFTVSSLIVDLGRVRLGDEFRSKQSRCANNCCENSCPLPRMFKISNVNEGFCKILSEPRNP